MKQSFGRTSRGFTLVEFLAVAGITIVLASIALPTISKMRESAFNAKCVSNLRQLGGALLQYAQEHDGQLPPNEGAPADGSGRAGDIWPGLLWKAGYLAESARSENESPCGRGVWTCPGARFVSENYGGYGVVEATVFERYDRANRTTGRFGSLRLTDIPHPSQLWLVGDATSQFSDVRGAWYAIWPDPSDWTASNHAPAPRHPGRTVNICMADGHVESRTSGQLRQNPPTIVR